MTVSDQPYIVNPGSVGDPDQMPVVQLPDAMAAHFERNRCPECGLINQCHADDCPLRDFVDWTPDEIGDRA